MAPMPELRARPPISMEFYAGPIFGSLCRRIGRLRSSSGIKESTRLPCAPGTIFPAPAGAGRHAAKKPSALGLRRRAALARSPPSQRLAERRFDRVRGFAARRQPEPGNQSKGYGRFGSPSASPPNLQAAARRLQPWPCCAHTVEFKVSYRLHARFAPPRLIRRPRHCDRFGVSRDFPLVLKMPAAPDIEGRAHHGDDRAKPKKHLRAASQPPRRRRPARAIAVDHACEMFPVVWAQSRLQNSLGLSSENYASRPGPRGARLAADFLERAEKIEYRLLIRGRQGAEISDHRIGFRCRKLSTLRRRVLLDGDE
jgi:hypothetical protein